MTTSPFSCVAVVGAGAWGTALAQVSARAGMQTILWGRDSDAMARMRAERENKQYLPGVTLEQNVLPTCDPSDLTKADMVLLVTPAQTVRSVCEVLRPYLKSGAPIVLCAKGIETKSRLFTSDVAAQLFSDRPIAVLSGPSFADDVARGLPTAVTIAAKDLRIAESIGMALGTTKFRLYHTSDVRGVEVGGSTKNVLAIACGVSDGCGLGASAKAALVARGFAELRRFGAAYGAEEETLMGLSGLGDLVLTCSSPQSRNFALGMALGQGAANAGGGKLAEGAITAEVVVEMAMSKNLDMPIATAVNALLRGDIDVQNAIASLMLRPQKQEG